ncbi:hypothetical protein Mapa_006184 [Marchantia paleacea]|nr:hypothetical protein Mapa_006184 [Marchantia paleacea]
MGITRKGVFGVTIFLVLMFLISLEHADCDEILEKITLKENAKTIEIDSKYYFECPCSYQYCESNYYNYCSCNVRVCSCSCHNDETTSQPAVLPAP